uniref:ANK_REP_REGION domain-containing protein n=1 Tax=Caenorhabditis tropicalis TaxID=1561998 RepID=A0A1I7TWX3_9PELO
MKLSCVLFMFSVFVIGALDYGSYDGNEEDYGSSDGMRFETYKKRELSNLRIVYERLAMIARITNAIALQYASLKKSIKVRDVVLELLKAPAENFGRLMERDPEEMLEKMGRVEGWIRDLEGSRKEMDELRTKEDLLELMSTSMTFAQEHFINETAIGSFISRIETGSFDKDTVGCDPYLVELTVNFTNLLGDQSSSNNVNSSELIVKMRERSLELQDCLGALEHYTKRITSIADESANFVLLEVTKQAVIKFHKSEKDIKKYGEVIDLTIDVFEKTRNLWMNPIGIGDKFQKEIEEFKEVIDTDREEADDYVATTLGFPEFGDMQMVGKDLKCDWFTNVIAHGRSVDDLGRNLHVFFNFSSIMDRIQGNWLKLKKDFSKNEESILQTAHDLQLIDQWSSVNAIEIAKTSKEAFRSGWTETFRLTPAELETVDKQLPEIIGLMGTVTKIQNFARDIKDNIDTAGFKNYLEKLRAANGTLDVPLIKNISNVEAMKKLNKHLNDLKGIQHELIDHLNTLRTEITVSQINNSSSILKLLEKSALRKNMERMKAAGDRFQPKLVLGMMKFTKTVFDLHNGIGESLGFSNGIKKTRKEILDLESYVKGVPDPDNPGNPILKLHDSMEVTQGVGRGMKVLRHMVMAFQMRNRLESIIRYPDAVNQKIQKFNEFPYVREFWKNSQVAIRNLLTQLATLDQSASRLKNESFSTMIKIFGEATKLDGIPEVFEPIHHQFDQFTKYPKIRKNFKVLSSLDLDFSAHKADLDAASMGFDEMNAYFDEIFGLEGDAIVEVEQNHLAAILICIGIFLLLIILALVGYGFTPGGRVKYHNYYLYWFGKPQDFEKRWRYSLFMDRQDGKNSVLDAVREINATNLKKTLSNGAYVNVYNRFGNTALHVATKRGHPEIAEILIRNGADRSLLNTRNRTPEMMIPKNYQESFPEKVEKYQELERIYKKLSGKKFRQRVPHEFPLSSYHIYIDHSTDDVLTDQFTERFQSITTDEATLFTTHYVVRTDRNGILETESLELIFWVLSGTIIVGDKWMVECLKNQKQIRNEWQFLVEKIKYKGTVFDTLPTWRDAMAKSQMPYLHGVYVTVVIQDYVNLGTLITIVLTHGGVTCDEIPDKQNYNKGFRPYLHMNMGPFIIIHDGKTNLDAYRKDGMYTLMTETEFVHFMLGRHIDRNLNNDPIPATDGLDD